jgi:DNA-binding transcriptional MerR regulator
MSSQAENERDGKAAVRGFYSPAELARAIGVSTDTLRYYERQRLLPVPPRGENGYRRYPPEALTRVRVIRSALAVGFSVDELTGIFQARERGLFPCKHVRHLAADKLKEVETRIRELHQLRRALSATLAGWDRLLARTPPGSPPRLLYNLADAEPTAARQLSPLLAPALRRKFTQRAKKSSRQL